MNFLMQGTEQRCVDLAAELLPDAEKELAAFVHVVRKSFGSKQARQSIEDWMEELESMEWPAGGAAPDWRCLTISAAARLACRAGVQRPRKPANRDYAVHYEPGRRISPEDRGGMRKNYECATTNDSEPRAVLEKNGKFRRPAVCMSECECADVH
jgi:hypothetical protein